MNLFSTQTERRRKKRSTPQPATATVKSIIESEVPRNRHEEVRRYLELFGYNPDRSILQVHVAGSFGGRATPKEIASRERAATRYQGRTFLVLGRTHDPAILQRLIPPRRRRRPDEGANEGYLGYLRKEANEGQKGPDEFIPLDFVPASLRYPRDWKELFGTLGYLITMHVPSKFARYKNELNNRLRRIRGDIDVKREWKFLDELTEYGYAARKKEEAQEDEPAEGAESTTENTAA